MSIIEKAIEKLEKQERQAHEAAASVREGAASAAAAQAAASAASRQPAIQIPLAQLGSRGFVTPDQPRSRIAEEYRMIKRPLLANIDGESAAPISNANMLLVTSALEGEGKTFTAINLAMSLCMEENRTVLLVDGDVAKASAGRQLGVPDDAPGLIDVLEHDDMHIEDVLLQTSIPNLRIIPVGRMHDRATELLASEAMRRIAQELSSRYADRIVVFDSPPLLLTSESSALVNQVGQIVFVVAAERTAPQAITEALGHISEDKVIGMVLNGMRSNPLDRYGYGYSYGYGYGYGTGVRGAAAHPADGLSDAV